MRKLKPNSLGLLTLGWLCGAALTANASVTQYATSQYDGIWLGQLTANEMWIIDLVAPDISAAHSFGISLAQNQVFGGKIAIDGGFDMTHEQQAWVTVESTSHPGTYLPLTGISHLFGDGLNVTWFDWSFLAPEATSYVVTYHVEMDGDKETVGAFTPIPEPSTLFAGLMAGIAFAPALGKWARRNLSAPTSN